VSQLEGHRHTDVKLWAELGSIKLPLMSVTTRFGLTTPPTATIEIPVGYQDGKGGDGLSPVHSPEVIAELKTDAVIKIFAKLTGSAGVRSKSKGGAGTVKQWPDGEFCIFDGFVGHVQSTATAFKASVSIVIRHWISKLSDTSLCSGIIDPHSPLDLRRSASYGGGETGGGLLVNGVFNSPFPTDKNIWTEQLKPVFQDIAAQDSIYYNAAVGYTGSANKAMTVPLKRMDNGDGEFMTIPELKLFGTLGSSGAGAGRRLSRTISGIMDGLKHGSTAWAKLVMLSKILGTAIAINTETATMIPYSPFSSKRHRHLSAGEVLYYKPRSRMFQKPRGCILMPHTPVSRIVSGPLGKSATASILQRALEAGALGVYPEDLVYPGSKTVTGGLDTETEGMLMFRHPPAWLEGAEVPVDFTTEFKPSRGQAQPPVGKNKKKAEKLAEEMFSLGGLYAKQEYALAYLKDSRGVLAAPLRFDICPGSVVSFDAHPDALSGATGLPGMSELSGCVNVVHTQLDAKSGQCQTVYDMMYVRREDDDSLSTDNPLFGESWPGSTLVKVFDE
jgi:hypothetical protein